MDSTIDIKVTNILDKVFAPFFPANSSLESKMEILRENAILDKELKIPYLKYFDFAASGLGYEAITNRIKYAMKYYANTHSMTSSNAIITSEIYELGKKKIKEYLGLDDSFALIYGGSGSTWAINRASIILGIYAPPRLKSYIKATHKKPKVVISSYEHHSNEMLWKEGICDVLKVGLDENDKFNLAELKKIVNKHKNLICSFSASSNVTGLRTPLLEVAEILKSKKGNLLFLDCSASASYENIDLDSDLFDGAFYSPHKALGGIGSCGILAIKKDLVDTSLSPSIAGGGSIEFADERKYRFFLDIQRREEAGTPPILQGLNAALSYQLRNEIGLDIIQKIESKLTSYAISKLSEIDRCIIYGPQEQRAGVISFNIDGISPFALSSYLSEHYGIQTRAGCSCAGPYGHMICEQRESMDFENGEISRPSWIRISLHYMHDFSDIDYLIDAIRRSVDSIYR